MVGILWAVLAAGQVIAPSPDPAPLAPAPAQVQEAVTTLLDLRDRAVEPTEWLAVGPAALPLLEATATDPRALPARRARSLEGLVALGSRRLPELVASLVRPGHPFAVRQAAIRASSVLSPALRYRLLRPLLARDPDEQIRGAAALALSRQPRGCAAVRAQSARESQAWRERFGDAARCTQVRP